MLEYTESLQNDVQPRCQQQLVLVSPSKNNKQGLQLLELCRQAAPSTTRLGGSHYNQSILNIKLTIMDDPAGQYNAQQHQAQPVVLLQHMQAATHTINT
jgi:hypothetical protein